MKKLKLFLAAALMLCSAGAWAQTDVTSTYLTNADFSQGPVITADIRGYGKDMVSGDVYGFQAVTGWNFLILSGDNNTAAYPNSAMGGGVLAYGSSNQLKGNNVTAPAAGPDASSVNGLGFFGVWGCGGYYYQDVTFAAGKYKITFPIYCISGTQANTTYTGFYPTSGTNRTVAINTTVGSWVNQTVEFTLTAETAGQIRLGYQSTGSGSGANPHLVFDGVKIEFTATVVKDVLANAISAAQKANAKLSDADLTAAISTAQAVYDNANATQEQVNAAAATLNTATELAMSAAGDVTDIFLTNADLSSVDGWTLSASAQYHDQGSYQIGGSESVRFAAPTADATHLTSEYAFGFECRWSTNYTSYYQTTDPVPAGVYTLTFDMENVNGGTSNASYDDRNYVEVNGVKTYSSTTEWKQGKSSWTTHTIRVTVNEAAPLTISFGYGTANNNIGSDNTPAIYVSHLNLSYSSFLSGAKAAWDEAKAAAEAAVADVAYENVTGEELTALNAEIAKAEPMTVDDYNSAAAALQTATATFTSAKAAYDELAALWGNIPYLEYASTDKYTAIGDAYRVGEDVVNAADATARVAAMRTAIRAYYESHAMAENVNGAVDMTDKVAAANADTNTGWTGGIGTNQGQGYTDAAGNVAPKYLDGGWAQNTGVNIDMTRSVEIPAGKYLLTVTARGAASLDEYTLSIGGKTVDVPHNGGEGGVFGNGWDDVSVEFETDGSTQTLEVKATSTASQQWISINRFRLVRLELYTEMAKEADYQAMEAALATAEAMTLGFDENEYAPYNNVEAIQAITTAKAVDKTVENAKADIEAITTALGNWTANTTEVDAIFDGQFATTAANTTSGDINLPGWTKVQGIRMLVKDEATDPGLAYTDGKAAVFSWGGTTLTYGEQDGYTLPLNKHSIYKLTFKASAWRDGTWPSWVSVELDGVAQSEATSVPGKINDTEGNPFRTYTYYLEPTADNSILKIYMNQHFTLADLSLKLAVAEPITINENADFTPAETYANVTLARTIKADTWNTFVVPFDITNDELKAAFGDEVAVAEFSENSADANAVEVNFNTMNTPAITANKPVLLKGNVGTSFTFNGKVIKEGDAKVAGTNVDFVGTYAASTTVKTGDYFISANKLYKSAGATTLKGTRAYIDAKNTTSAVKLFIDDIETAIEAINGEGAEDGVIYNIAGQRVNKAQKGIYIQNGKKVLVK